MVCMQGSSSDIWQWDVQACVLGKHLSSWGLQAVQEQDWHWVTRSISKITNWMNSATVDHLKDHWSSQTPTLSSQWHDWDNVSCQFAKINQPIPHKNDPFFSHTLVRVGVLLVLTPSPVPFLSRRPAHSTYLRLTHKPWASYGHALGLSD